MGADAVHAVVDAVAGAVEVALDAQRGKLVGEHAQPPARRVGAGARSVGGAMGEQLGRGQRLLPGAERAQPAARLGARAVVVRALGPVGGDDDPAANDRIFSQFGHRANLRVTARPFQS